MSTAEIIFDATVKIVIGFSPAILGYLGYLFVTSGKADAS